MAAGTAVEAAPAPSEPQVTSPDRLVALDGRTLREHAARGTLINSGFQVGLAGLGLLRRMVVAAYLTQSQFGVWGIVMTTVLTLSWLKEIGVADKYVQQNEADQERAFQKAFTMELAISLAFFALMAAALPAYALAYSVPAIILPGLVLAFNVPLSAFESPIWIPYRRMQFVRQRMLSAVDPVVALAVTVALAVAGAGYWSLVLGAVAGSFAGGLTAVASSPYPVRIRFDRQTLRDYASFSWPLFGLGVSTLLVVQGMMLVSKRSVGLAGLGAIGLAASITSFADTVDGVISQALYPAICAVAHRRDKLHEAFVKSNRLALIWAVPFGVAVALFSHDLVRFGFGERWESAAGILGAMGLVAALSQIGYNFAVFFRAVGDTRPMMRLALVALASFALVAVPLVLAFGLTGYALAWAAMMLIQVAGRGYYLSRLFRGFRMARHFARAMAPSVPAALFILGLRLVEPGHRTAAMAAAELALYAAATIAGTLFFERNLVSEVTAYVRRRARPAPAA
ncbi:MAG TPA: oligosaccharide flippase family protein [Thermoleophilaceae bacterium]|nr:oligosaccharide flippase family protein [Thermoleophilaceae bacterium]